VSHRAAHNVWVLLRQVFQAFHRVVGDVNVKHFMHILRLLVLQTGQKRCNNLEGLRAHAACHPGVHVVVGDCHFDVKVETASEGRRNAHRVRIVSTGVETDDKVGTAKFLFELCEVILEIVDFTFFAAFDCDHDSRVRQVQFLAGFDAKNRREKCIAVVN